MGRRCSRALHVCSDRKTSSVVIAAQKEPVSAAVGAATSEKVHAWHPLVTDGQKMLPSITRVFRSESEFCCDRSPEGARFGGCRRSHQRKGTRLAPARDGWAEDAPEHYTCVPAGSNPLC